MIFVTIVVVVDDGVFSLKKKDKGKIIIYINLMVTKIKTKAAYEEHVQVLPSDSAPCIFQSNFWIVPTQSPFLPFPCVQCSDVDVHEHDRVWKNDSEVV